MSHIISVFFFFLIFLYVPPKSKFKEKALTSKEFYGALPKASGIPWTNLDGLIQDSPNGNLRYNPTNLDVLKIDSPNCYKTAYQ